MDAAGERELPGTLASRPPVWRSIRGGAFGSLALDLTSGVIVAGAAVPFGGWRTPALWLAGMVALAVGAHFHSARLERLGRSGAINPFTWLASAGYSAAALYLVYAFDGAAQTLGVTLYGVVMFQILARDYACPRRLAANLAAPIASMVLVQAYATMLLLQHDHAWRIVTLLASPLVVFRAFRAVQNNLNQARRQEREALAALSESETRYRLFAERSPDIILRYDTAGCIEYVSPAALDYGYEPDALVGRNVADMVDPSERARNDAFMADLAAGRPTPKGPENVWRTWAADGAPLAFEGATSVLYDDQGRVIGAMSALRDVTARVALEDELRARRAEAEAANEAKSAFLATMSHEIRTPLNGVLGMARAMAGDELSPVQRRRLEVVCQSGESLLSLLNDVLDLAKVEAGKLELETEPFDIGEVVESARAMFAGVAEGKGLALEVVVDEAALGTYLGDAIKTRQIITNLVSNALKFTEQGGVKVAVARTRAGIAIRVSDTGIGIAADRVGHLFRKFEQADASTTRRYGGTGLGLAICREFSQLMGGSVKVTSKPGKGATFVVDLPLTRLADRAVEEALASAVPAPPAARAGPPPRVLAAEDNKVNQLVLRTLLNQAGIEPVIVDDGQAAVDAWEQGQWDVILMDVQMPVMDGPTAARLIRQRERATGRAPTPIIALTANVMSHQLREYELAGMNGQVAKPIQVAALFAGLEAALQQEPPVAEARSA